MTKNTVKEREWERVVADLEEIRKIDIALVQLMKRWEAVDINSAKTEEFAEFGRRIREAHQATYMATAAALDASSELFKSRLAR